MGRNREECETSRGEFLTTGILVKQIGQLVSPLKVAGVLPAVCNFEIQRRHDDARSTGQC
jgi:hypothetical protein